MSHGSRITAIITAPTEIPPHASPPASPKKSKTPSKVVEEVDEDPLVLPTRGDVWSLNKDGATGKCFWWNRDYRISTWQNHLSLKTPMEEACDTEVWRAYQERQDTSVYKQCGLCNGPQDSDDMFLCCYCGSAVHIDCSKEATSEQIAWKDANATMVDRMRCCFTCDAVPAPDPPRAIIAKQDDVRRTLWRVCVLLDEYPAALQKKIRAFEKEYSSMSQTDGMARIQTLVALHFQREQERFQLTPIVSKGNGTGVRALKFIPKYTRVGVYPGYLDVMSGEQCKAERPTPKYSLVDMNCADYFNRVFPELQKCITPFLNEPMPDELSNTAWIQETMLPEGRLSIVTVKDIQAGEEVMIGYGPLYPRTYDYNYDAYAFHPVEGYHNPPCFALWHWKTTNENDGTLICYCGYNAKDDSYYLWEDDVTK